MLRFFKLIIVSVLICHSLQAQMLYLNFLSGGNDVQGRSFTRNEHNDVFVTGSAAWFQLAYNATFILKVDYAGTAQWMTYYNLNAHVLQPSKIVLLKNGNLAVCGILSNTVTDGFIFVTDSSGSLLWSSMTTTGIVAFKDIYATSDGGCIVFGTNVTGPIAIRFDVSGNLVWSKEYQVNASLAAAIAEQDGGYSLGIQLNSNAGVIRIDSSGNVLWANVYGSSALYQISGMSKTANGSILHGLIYNSGYTDRMLIRIDSTGNLLWSKIYSLYSSAESGGGVFSTSHGEFVVLGYSNQLVSGPGVLGQLLFKMDSDGNLYWIKNYRTKSLLLMEGFDYSANEYLFTGWVDSDSSIQDIFHIALFKTDSSGHSSCDYDSISATVSSFPLQSNSLNMTAMQGPNLSALPISENPWGVNTLYGCGSPTVIPEIRPEQLSVTPNPASNSFHIEKTLDEQESSQLLIYNSTGQCVRNARINSVGIKSGIEISDLPGGYYYLQLMSDTRIIGNAAFIKQ